MRVFKEEQRFTQLWIIVLILFSAIVPITILIKEYIDSKTHMSITELISGIGLILIASLLIFVFKLTTRIDEKGIHYQFFPFHLKPKSIKWKTISTAYIRQYDALGEYGGWGLKGGLFWKKSNGIAINISGDIGIQLELKNGKKILIGTQNKHDANKVLTHYNDLIN